LQLLLFLALPLLPHPLITIIHFLLPLLLLLLLYNSHNSNRTIVVSPQPVPMVFKMEIIFFVPVLNKVGVSVESLAPAIMNSISKLVVVNVMLVSMVGSV
jgi:hypothetical protein